MAMILSFFEDRVISKDLWLPRSPDLTPPDSYLWGHIKERMFRYILRTTDALKQHITNKTRQTDSTILRHYRHVTPNPRVPGGERTSLPAQDK